MPTKNRKENNGNDPIAVYLVDDHPAIRNAIRARIADVPDMEVCGESGSSEKAIRQIEELDPAVAVVDISLEDGDGLDLIETLPARCPDVHSLVFSIYNENVYAERALSVGAAGYLMKKESLSTLTEAIRTVSGGNVYLSKKMAARVLNRVMGEENGGRSVPTHELTDREMAVFRMVGQGHSVEDIEERLSLARKTVESYRRRAKEKLGFNTVRELLVFAVRWTLDRGTHSEEEEGAGPYLE